MIQRLNSDCKRVSHAALQQIDASFMQKIVVRLHFFVLGEVLTRCSEECSRHLECSESNNIPVQVGDVYCGPCMSSKSVEKTLHYRSMLKGWRTASEAARGTTRV